MKKRDFGINNLEDVFGKVYNYMKDNYRYNTSPFKEQFVEMRMYHVQMMIDLYKESIDNRPLTNKDKNFILAIVMHDVSKYDTPEKSNFNHSKSGAEVFKRWYQLGKFNNIGFSIDRDYVYDLIAKHGGIYKKQNIDNFTIDQLLIQDLDIMSKFKMSYDVKYYELLEENINAIVYHSLDDFINKKYRKLREKKNKIRSMSGKLLYSKILEEYVK